MAISITKLEEEIKAEFLRILANPQKREIPDMNWGDTFGHAAGGPVEKWIKTRLETINANTRLLFPEDFLKELFEQLRAKEANIDQFLAKTWWGLNFGNGRLLVTERQIKEFINTSKISPWQQAAGDLVLFYGTDLLSDQNKIILINVKSHFTRRESRPPNIMSVERLLKFFDRLFSFDEGPSLLQNTNIWFIGVDYDKSDTGCFAKGLYLRDLFSLDMQKCPQINFDAAIQLQWRVSAMLEKEPQTKIEFVSSLLNVFLRMWHRHAESKEKKYLKIAESLHNNLKKRSFQVSP